MKNKKQNLEKEGLGNKLQKIREHLGRVIVCKIGVTETGKFDVLEIETVVPHTKENNNKQSKIKKTKLLGYIG
jgi:hypothetical protein